MTIKDLIFIIHTLIFNSNMFKRIWTESHHLEAKDKMKDNFMGNKTKGKKEEKKKDERR